MVWFLCIGCLIQKYPRASNYFNSSLLQCTIKKNIHFLKTLNFCLVAELVEYLLTKQFSILKTWALHMDETVFRDATVLKRFFTEWIKHLYCFIFLKLILCWYICMYRRSRKNKGLFLNYKVLKSVLHYKKHVSAISLSLFFLQKSNSYPFLYLFVVTLELKD